MLDTKVNPFAVTEAQKLTKKYGLKLLSSGLLYRYVSYKLLLKNRIKNRNAYLKSITKSITLKKLNSTKLYDPVVTENTSVIAKSKKIRILLKKFQKKFAQQKLVCIEGRDIGSVICPNADVKFFFKCSLDIRAKRRLNDFKKANKKITLKDVKKALKKRDLIDTKRKNSPLRIPDGAVIVDTSKLNKKQMFGKISRIVKDKLILKYGRNY